MSARTPGRLLASGRSADVYELDADWVLRRYRGPVTVEREARIMTYVRERGYPVPEVREAGGTDLVLERLRGPTMLEDLARKPWTLLRHARTLADLHQRLHRIPASPDLPTPLGEGDTLVHRDLHPLNVILTEKGPVVIDWSAAARGNQAADVAETWILLAVGEVQGSRFDRLLARVGRGLFLRTFLSSLDREAAAARIPAVAASRMTDRNMTDGERRAIVRLVERVTRPAP